MSRIRIACYNIAWFSRLFDQRNRLIDDLEWSALYKVTRRRQGEAIAQVLRYVNADCYAIIEAPNSGRKQSCVAALTGFAEEFGLRQRAALIGFENSTHQEIALLFDPDEIEAEHAPLGEVLAEGAARHRYPPSASPRFDGVFPADLNDEGAVKLHRFSKPPLEAVVEHRRTGFSLQVIAVHLKSKGLRGVHTAEQQRRLGLENRDKQYAQAVWLRRRIEEHIAAGDNLIILGDFNDGPGLDGFESLNGRSSIETVIGDRSHPNALLASPFTHQHGGKPATARFYDGKGGFLDALIDFIMLTPRLALQVHPRWRIWHPFNDAGCASDQTLQQALLDASDHFPVSVDISLPGD